MAISFVGAGIIWKFVYAYRAGGPGPDRPAQPDRGRGWAANPSSGCIELAAGTRCFLIVVMIWIQAGFAMVVLSAAIKAIPAEIVEAARLDGASPGRCSPGDAAEHPARLIVVVTVTITDRHAEGLRHRPDDDRRQVRHQRHRQRDVHQAFRYSETGQGRGAALAVFLFVLVMPIVDLPGPAAAEASGRHPMTHTRRPTRQPPTHPAQPDGAARSTTRQQRVRRAAHHAASPASRRDRHRGPVDDPHLRPAPLLVPAGGRDQDHRLVDVLHRPAAHPGELPRGAVRHLGRPPASWPATSSTRSSSPSPRCCSRSAFAALAAYALAWMQFRGRDWIFVGDLRAADRAAADGAGPAAAVLLQGVSFGVQLLPAWNLAATDVRPGVVRAHLLRACRWASSCCTTSCPSSRRPDGGGPGGRRRPRR